MRLPNSTDITKDFIRDAESISKTLINLFSLKYSEETPELADPILRWLDFRLRYIDSKPREVIFSRRFYERNLSAESVEALKIITNLIRSGGDINPYQGRGLTLRHDTSGGTKDSRTDLLWADWGIHHLHLSPKPIPIDRYFSYPADKLVFCLVFDSTIAFVDVLPHPDKEGFSNPDLIEAIYESWPEYLKQFELKGIMPSVQPSQTDIHQLRSSGIQPPFSIEGKAYMGAGLRFSVAATSMKVTFSYGNLMRGLQNLAELVAAPSGQFYTDEVKKLDAPKFSLITSSRGLCIYEEQVGQAVILPLKPFSASKSYLEMVHDLLFPNWVREVVAKKSADGKLTQIF